jgi:CheY-like chemotaxis protein
MKRKKILVIDDDPVHLVLTKDLLEEEGHEVLVHGTPFGATQKILVTGPDLVLLDVNMPALSGEGLASLLRRHPRTHGTRILLHSSNDEEALRAAVERLGLTGYVCKGDPVSLRRSVARVLES